MIRSFCYLPRPLQLHRTNGTYHVLDATHTSLPLYFSLKAKHDYYMIGKGPFIEDVQAALSVLNDKYDVVVIPESRFSFLDHVISNFPNVLRISKRSKLEIFERALQTPSWRKLDRQAAEKAYDEMGETFTINTIKSNKRKDYVPHLFEEAHVYMDARMLIADDFIMSGNTIKALAASVGRTFYDELGIFYQTGAADEN